MDVLSNVHLNFMLIPLYNNVNHVQAIANNVLIPPFVHNVTQVIILIQLLMRVNYYVQNLILTIFTHKMNVLIVLNYLDLIVHHAILTVIILIKKNSLKKKISFFMKTKDCVI